MSSRRLGHQISLVNVCNEVTSSCTLLGDSSPTAASPSPSYYGSVKDTCSGIFIDYLCRKDAMQKKDDAVEMLLSGRNDFFKGGGDIADAQALVNRERVHHHIMRLVTVLWKQQDVPEWHVKDNAIIRNLTMMLKLKRLSVGLRAEVLTVVTQRKLTNLLKAKDAESAERRKGRVQGFWSQFHNEGQKVVPPAQPQSHSRQSPGRGMPTLLQGKRPQSSGCIRRVSKKIKDEEHDEDEADIAPALPQRPLSAPNKVKPPGTHLPPQQQPDPTNLWKQRQARSRCSAGAWEWTKGLEGGSRRALSAAGRLDRSRGGMMGGTPSRRLSNAMNVTSMPSLLKFSCLTQDVATLEKAKEAAKKQAQEAARRAEEDQLDLIRRRRSMRYGPQTPADQQQMVAQLQAQAKTSKLWWKKDEAAVPTLGSGNLAMLPRHCLQRCSSVPNRQPQSAGSAAGRHSRRSSISRPNSAAAGPRPAFASRPGSAAGRGRALGQSASELGVSELEIDSEPIPETSSFFVPWKTDTAGKSLWRDPDSPTKQYLRACEASCIVPTPTCFITGHSTKLDAKGKALADEDLLAIAATVSSMAVEDIDLEGNGLLSDTALAELAEMLQGTTAGRGLKRLSLRHCNGAGQSTISTIISLLSSKSFGLLSLNELDLSGIAISAKHHLPLAQAIRDHPTLRTACLAETGLGNTPFTERVLCDLCGSAVLKNLDLGWNCFSAEVFTAMGKQLVENQVLESLVLANCASADHSADKVQKVAPKAAAGKLSANPVNEKPISPVVFFIECLMHDDHLKHLDISLNRLDYRGALILEDALENSKTTASLNLSYNPLGVLGFRSIMRLLGRDTSGLVRFECEDCFKGSDHGYQVFSSTKPNGKYLLELSRPYHRAFLRMLYKTTERFQLSFDAAFMSSEFVPPPFVHASKDSHGVWQVPTHGRLITRFSVDKAVEAAVQKMNQWDYEAYLSKHFDLMRLHPGFRKVVPLFVQWQQMEGRADEQRVMLEALSKDFYFTSPQIEMFCHAKTMAADVIAKLLHCVPGGQSQLFLSVLHVPTLGECIKVLKTAKSFLMFNPNNPTGSYKFDLGVATDYAAAERLICLDTWEISLKKRLGRPDTSQHGNMSHLRNVRYNDTPLPCAQHHGICEWNVPQKDILEFDYSSTKRPPEGAPIFDAELFEVFLMTLHRFGNRWCGDAQLNEALRQCSHYLYVTALQMRQILGLYRDKAARSDVFVIFFNRVLDMHNEKVFRGMLDSDGSVQGLRDRLGFATYFPYIQPEQTRFRFDLLLHDQRLAANALINLANKESRNNLRSPSYVHANGYVDPLPTGIPRGWDSFEKMPKSGVFKVAYVCGPEQRSFKARCAFQESLGGCEVKVNEPEVMWWAFVHDAPDDVLDFLRFLSSKYKDFQKAFKAVDGHEGTGQITLHSFREGLNRIGCQIFKGRDENHRLQTVFRYLDPTGEGQVSRDEWGELGLLKAEMILSCTELFQFLSRMFRNDMKAAWSNVAGGPFQTSLTEEEWCTALGELGYFGPAKCVFAHIGGKEKGVVSYADFKTLRDLKNS
eukprot:TRINITY_DN13507_c0_g2_i1.p1 TRINITY_DN13507_c0_g2~~TRINITY_DN13507_c0_g2_i1.p1  ORF type:complete len:1554 (+),score=406.14 TRINITY_DN13507_c0_g2_i1:199-4860(+)